MNLAPYYVKADGPDVKAKLDDGPVLILSPESARLLASDLRLIDAVLYEGNWQEKIIEMLEVCADEAEKCTVH